MTNLTGTWTLFKRESQRFMKVWMQTILAPVVSNLLFLMIFGLSLSKSVATIGGVSYLAFIVPGLIMMGIINNAFQNPSSSIIIMKYQGIITDLMTVPLTKAELLLAFTASAVVRGLIVGIITLITSVFFVEMTYISPFFIVISSMLAALFFSFFGILVGIWAKDFDKFAFIQSFVLTPLIFLGGVFYPVSTLPAPFAKLSAFNPIVYMIDLLRYGFTGVNEFALSTGLIVTTSLTLATGLIAYFVLRSGWRLQT